MQKPQKPSDSNGLLFPTRAKCLAPRTVYATPSARSLSLDCSRWHCHAHRWLRILRSRLLRRCQLWLGVFNPAGLLKPTGIYIAARVCGTSRNRVLPKQCVRAAAPVCANKAQRPLLPPTSTAAATPACLWPTPPRMGWQPARPPQHKTATRTSAKQAPDSEQTISESTQTESKQWANADAVGQPRRHRSAAKAITGSLTMAGALSASFLE